MPGPDRLSQASGNREETPAPRRELVELDPAKPVNNATPVPRFYVTRELLQMSSHIEQTVAGERHCLVRRILPTLSRLLAVSRYAFRVSPDAAVGTPDSLCTEAVKRVQFAACFGYRRAISSSSINPALYAAYICLLCRHRVGTLLGM